MRIEVASLVAGSDFPAGDGIHGALRCVIRTPDGILRRAVLKRGNIDDVCAEAFGAMVLRAWGLPVPDPYLVDEDGKIGFASADTGYPNLKQKLDANALPDGPAKDLAHQRAAALAISLPSAPLAAACDEAISNRDRNLGNILWDGKSEAWIDHSIAFDLRPAHQDRNLLCLMAVSVGDPEAFCRSAIARSFLLERGAVSDADAAMSASPAGATRWVALVASRLANLGNRIVSRFPQPPGLPLGP